MPQALKEILNLKDKRDVKNPVFYDQSIKHQSFDIELYNDLKEMSPVLNQTLEEGESKLKTFPDLSRDLFMGLFKYSPEIRTKEEMTPSRRFNHEMVGEFMETEDFKKLRDMCKLNLLNSAIGTEVLHNKALVKIDTIIEERRRQQQQNGGGDLPPDLLEMINQMVNQENQIKNDLANQQPQGQDQGTPDAFGGGGIANDVGTGDGQSNPGTSRLTEEAAKKLAELQQQMANSPGMQKMEQDIQNALQQAAKEAQEDVREMDKFVNAWGLDSSDSASRVSFDECREALERIRNSDELKKLTEIIGRFRTIAKNNLKKKSKGEGQSIKDVTIGNKMDKTLPSEKTLLADKRTKKMFYKKYNEKQLLQYEVQNTKRKGMGPMVVCLDVSGSMNDGKRDVWGRAVALALLEVAQRQKRNYALLMFNTKIAKQWIIPKGELNPNDVLDIAEIKFGGGTTFDVPVKRAMELIKKEQNFRKGDIVFITDGDCMMSESYEKEFIKMKEEKNIYVQTIIINMGGHCSDQGVESWSDQIKKVSKLADLNEDTASDIFNLSIDG